MTSIKLEVTGAKAWATVTGPLTSGMVGIPVTIEYDETWEGLTKNLVCRCGLKDSDGGETRTILNVDKTAVVAHEVMQAGQYLYLGVEGFREDGTLVMPTTWARSENLIQHGSDSDADPSVDPLLPVWGQLQAQIDQINREGISPEQMEEIRACAETAAQAAETAAGASDTVARAAQSAAVNAGRAEAAAARAEDAAMSSSGLALDATLTESGKAADAKAVGDRLEILEGSASGDGLTAAQVSALHGMFQVCLYDENKNADGAMAAFETAFGIDDPGDDSGDDSGGGTGGTVDTTAVIEHENKMCMNGGGLGDNSSAGVTKFYDLPALIEGSGDTLTLCYWIPRTAEDFGISQLHWYYDDTFVVEWGQQYTAPDAFTESERTLTYSSSPVNKVRFTVYPSCISLSYAYIKDTGDVLFAGADSPYYGMANIDGTPAVGDPGTDVPDSGTDTVSVLSVDDDYAMDYSVSAASIITGDSGTIAAATGLDAEYAAAIESAKNAWMIEANGSTDKIPLILHTDQHGYFSKPLWDTIARMVDWYEISKVVNLGDTVPRWIDADEEHPLTVCDELAQYNESMSSVSYSRRIEVFGNHDTNKAIDGKDVRMVPQGFLRKYFKNIYARRGDSYGNMVVYDDTYNVKYLIYSGLGQDDRVGSFYYCTFTESVDWIIRELSKADGYDVVLLSHINVGYSSSEAFVDPTGENNTAPTGSTGAGACRDLFIARKNKASGTVKDQFGVTHEYDFTQCDGELLCGLHGHEHSDGYFYLGGALLEVLFDAYFSAPKAFFFVLIDRENRQINVWKVDDTPKVQNYQIPMDAPGEGEGGAV